MKHFLKSVVSLIIVFTTTALHGQEEQPMIGQTAPSFELKSLDSKDYSLAQLKEVEPNLTTRLVMQKPAFFPKRSIEKSLSLSC